MEELLNKLIQRGWKPFGWDDELSSLHKEYGVGKWYIRFHNGMDSESFDLRQLTSKESGLRQFCVKNKLVNVGKTYIKAYTKRFRDVYELKKDEADEYSDTEYEYWLIECALRDESDLEKFLLDNIKI